MIILKKSVLNIFKYYFFLFSIYLIINQTKCQNELISDLEDPSEDASNFQISTFCYLISI